MTDSEGLVTSRQVAAAEFKAKCLRIIKEMQETGESVVVTRRGHPVAIVSLPPSAEPAQPIFGSMRGSVIKYDDPFEPAASPEDWSALR